MESMEQENKFLNMLGYKKEVVPNSNNTRWNVFDEKNNIVGTIQRKKLRRKNKNKGLLAEFGYITEIDSDIISMRKTRWINDEYDNFSYRFEIKRPTEENDTVEMSCGQFPSITIWSKEHGYMQFHIGHDSLFANFKSKTENFNMEEVVVYKWDSHYEEKHGDYEKEYTYQISYCRPPNTLDDMFGSSKGRTSREITAKYDPHYYHYQNRKPITIEERTWINGKLRTNRTNNYDGTIEEVIEKQQMGIDAVSHFRHLLNSILPFNQEIMGAMLSKTLYVAVPGVEFFLPDLVEELKEDPCLDCSTSGTCDMLEIIEQNCLTLKKHKIITGKPYIRA